MRDCRQWRLQVVSDKCSHSLEGESTCLLHDTDTARPGTHLGRECLPWQCLVSCASGAPQCDVQDLSGGGSTCPAPRTPHAGAAMRRASLGEKSVPSLAVSGELPEFLLNGVLFSVRRFTQGSTARAHTLVQACQGSCSGGKDPCLPRKTSFNFTSLL